MLGRLPRQPAAHATNHQIVLGILALKNLAPQLRLLVRRECTADLDATDIALEAVSLVERLLHLLLVLEEEYLVLLRDIRLLDVLTVGLLELVDILHDIVHLERILRRDIGRKVLEALDLPLIIHPLNELLEEEIVLLLDYLLRRDERYNAVPLVGELGVLLEVIHQLAVLVRREFNLGPSRRRAHLYSLALHVKMLFSRDCLLCFQ